MPTVESEANELLQGASRAIHDNNILIKLNTMPEVHEALDKLINLHCHSPYSIAMCSFILGVYMGIEYNSIKKFEE
jgi:hypothetical protein